MRKRPLGLLIGLGSAVVVVAVVAAVVAIAVSRASDPGMPGTPDLGSYQIVPPAQLNGATLVTQPGVASAYAADSVNAGFLTPALWNGDPTPFGGVYASSGSVQPQFIFFGAYGALSDPGGAESGAWQALSGDGGTYTDLAAYPPGSPGGSLQCAEAAMYGEQFPVCIWADHGSVGELQAPHAAVSTPADPAALTD